MHTAVFLQARVYSVQINNGKRKEIIVLLSLILVPVLKFSSPEMDGYSTGNKIGLVAEYFR